MSLERWLAPVHTPIPLRRRVTSVLRALTRTETATQTLVPDSTLLAEYADLVAVLFAIFPASMSEDLPQHELVRRALTGVRRDLLKELANFTRLQAAGRLSPDRAWAQVAHLAVEFDDLMGAVMSLHVGARRGHGVIQYVADARSRLRRAVLLRREHASTLASA